MKTMGRNGNSTPHLSRITGSDNGGAVLSSQRWLAGGWRVVGGGLWGGGLFLAAQMLQGLHLLLDPPRTRCVRGALEMR